LFLIGRFLKIFFSETALPNKSKLGALRKLNTKPSIGASHQVSVHLAKQLKRRF
jgi:hypothetical protein